MDSIVEKAGAVFPFPDPKPVHFVNSGGNKKPPSNAESYVSNPYEPSKYLHKAYQGTATYYNENDEIIWAVNVGSFTGTSEVSRRVFFCNINTEGYALFVSDTYITRVKLLDGTTARMVQTTKYVSFAVINGDVCVATASGQCKILDVSTMTTIGDYISGSFDMYANTVANGKIKINHFIPSTAGWMLDVSIYGVGRREFRLPPYSASWPTLEIGELNAISPDTLAIIGNSHVPASNTGDKGEPIKYWELESVDIWFRNIVRHYTGYQL